MSNGAVQPAAQADLVPCPGPARPGRSATPYDLKRHVAATIGHFWSFPHALLYKEPPRLVELGLLTEEREQDGRRRRLFGMTDAGRTGVATSVGVNDAAADRARAEDDGARALMSTAWGEVGAEA